MFYPDIYFDPINLYNLPYQKMVEVVVEPGRVRTTTLWRVDATKEVDRLLSLRTIPSTNLEHL